MTGVLSADVSNVKLNLVFFLEGYKLVILVVVVSLTQLDLDDTVSNKIIEVNYLLSMQGSH